MRRNGPISRARTASARRSGARWKPEMGIHVVKVPDIGEGIAEVEMVEWHVRPGDTVAADQVLADVMTDKATVEVPSPVAGTVIAVKGNAGDKLAVGSELLPLDTAATGTAESGEHPVASETSPSQAAATQAPATLLPSTAATKPIATPAG